MELGILTLGDLQRDRQPGGHTGQPAGWRTSSATRHSPTIALAPNWSRSAPHV